MSKILKIKQQGSVWLSETTTEVITNESVALLVVNLVTSECFIEGYFGDYNIDGILINTKRDQLYKEGTYIWFPKYSKSNGWDIFSAEIKGGNTLHVTLLNYSKLNKE